MIILWPDNSGEFNKKIEDLYKLNRDTDLYTGWTCFDSFLYGEGFYEWRIKQRNPGISTSELNHELEKKNAEFTKIQDHLSNHKIKWLLELEGLIDFAVKRAFYEYNITDIPTSMISSTLDKVVHILENNQNYEIAISKDKLPFFYSGGEKAGLVLLRREHREATGISGIYLENHGDVQSMVAKFNEIWAKSIKKEEAMKLILSFKGIADCIK